MKLYERRNWTRTLVVVVTMAAAAAILNGVASSAQTANIVWAKSVDETGRPADVLTGGTLVAAVTAGKSTTVNGVKFVGQTPSKTVGTIVFGAAPITVEAIQTPYESYGAAPAKWDAGYRSLVAGAAYSEYPDGHMAIRISGLTAGHKYVVQIFEAFWNANFATVFVGGKNSSSPVNLSGPARPGAGASGMPQYVTGTFTAGSDGETISLTSTTGYTLFDAMQLRDMSVASAGKK